LPKDPRDISSLLIQNESGSGDRAAPSAARSLARGDEHVFPSLRLPPIVGETGLDNILRQIEALTRAPPPPALLPAPERPQPREAKRARPAAPRHTEPPRASGRTTGPALSKITFGIAALGLVCLAVLPSYPDELHLLARWIPPRVQAKAAASAPAAAPAQGVAIVAIPTAPAERPALTPPAPTLAPVPAADAEPTPGAPKPDAPPPQPAAPTKTAALASPAAESTRPAPVAVARPSTPATGDSASPASDRATAPRPAAQAGTVALLLDRGNQLLASGDVASARQFFERANEVDGAAAARAIGATYDPLVLRRMKTVGVKPDAALAAQWYRRAAEAGDAQAGDDLRRLESARHSAEAWAP